MTDQDYINGQLQSDVEYLKDSIDKLSCRPEKCRKEFISRKILIVGLVCLAIGYGLINLPTAISFFIP
jgi:hypothetical protein